MVGRYTARSSAISPELGNACHTTPTHLLTVLTTLTIYHCALTVLGALELKNSYHTLSEEEKAFRRQVNPPRNPKPRAAPPQSLPSLAAAASMPPPAAAAADADTDAAGGARVVGWRELPRGAPGLIPKLILQTWRTASLPPKFHAAAQRVRQLHPDFTYMMAPI